MRSDANTPSWYTNLPAQEFKRFGENRLQARESTGVLPGIDAIGEPVDKVGEDDGIFRSDRPIAPYPVRTSMGDGTPAAARASALIWCMQNIGHERRSRCQSPYHELYSAWKDHKDELHQKHTST